MKSNKIKLMCLTGIFTAIIFVFTAYIHIPSHTGYTHVGDTFIYLAACLLPMPYAAFAGAVGAMFADLFCGFAMWAPGSVIIKAVSVLFFTRKAKMLSIRNLSALLPANLVSIGGYYLYEAIITGNFVSPIAGIPGYIMQSVLSCALFVIIGIIFDKFNLKERLS